MSNSAEASFAARPLGVRDRLSRLFSRRPVAPWASRGAGRRFRAVSADTTGRACLGTLNAWWLLLRDTFDATHGFLFITGLVCLVSAALAILPQGQDLVTNVAQDGGSQAYWLAAALLWLGLQAWFWMRRIVEVQFGVERTEWGPAKDFLVWAPRLVGGVPLAVVTLVFLVDRSSGFRDLNTPGRPPLVEALLVIFCVGYAAYVVGRTRSNRLERWAKRLPWMASPTLGMGMALLLLAIFSVFPVTLAQAIGPAAIVFMAAACILPLMTIAIQVGQALQVPIPPLLILAALIFSFVNDGQHAVGGRLFGRLPEPLLPPAQSRQAGSTAPTTTADPGVDDRPTLSEAFAKWSRAQDAGGAPAERRTFVVIAAEGGASRAGIWTAVALERLNALTGGELARRTFAISSISGGSVGAVGWSASLGAPGCKVRPSDYDAGRGEAPTCLDQFVNADALSPALAGMFFPDLVQRFLPLPIFPDRARALELAWETAWAREFGASSGAPSLARPYLALWRSQHGSQPVRTWTPYVIVGGASEESGRRVLTTPVRLAPEIKADVDDFYDLYHRDILASTAIHNGARFPWISPAGLLKDARGPTSHIVDGGYFDGSGVQTALDLLTWVSQNHKEVRPVLIVLRYRDDKLADPPRPWLFANDLVAPIVGGASSRSALQNHFDDTAPAQAPGKNSQSSGLSAPADAAQSAPYDRATLDRADIVLTGRICGGLPLNWKFSRKSRRYVESLGGLPSVAAALREAAGVVLGRSNASAPEVPMSPAEKFSCPNET